MFPGETIKSGAAGTCECGHEFKFEVMRSNAYYVGTMCHNVECEYYGHPYSRESDYFNTRQETEEALKSGEFSR